MKHYFRILNLIIILKSSLLNNVILFFSNVIKYAFLFLKMLAYYSEILLSIEILRSVSKFHLMLSVNGFHSLEKVLHTHKIHSSHCKIYIIGWQIMILIFNPLHQLS